MKIWILNQYAVPPDSPGGTRHYDFAAAMASKGHEVTLIASNFNHWTKRDRIPGKKVYQFEKVGQVQFLWVKTAPYWQNNFKRIWNMVSFFLRTWRLPLREKPDVILGSSPHLLAPLSAWILAKHYRVPFVMEVRDLWPETLVRLGQPPPRMILKGLRLLERFLYRKTTLLISMVTDIQAYFASQKIKLPPLVYLPNPVDANRYRILPGAEGTNVLTALKEMKKNGLFVFGYVGAHGPANDLETVIAAAASLKPEEKIQIVLIGDGPSKQELEKKAAALPQVSFFSAIPRQEVPVMLSGMDALIFSVHPTLESTLGSPNKLLDYMASGKPVLCAASLPGRPVEKAECGFPVAPQSPDQLCEAMRKMASLEEESLAKMGERGRTFVFKQHDLGMLTDRLLEALNRITRKGVQV